MPPYVATNPMLVSLLLGSGSKDLSVINKLTILLITRGVDVLLEIKSIILTA